MKGYEDFKGYSTRLDYNAEKGGFVATSVPHAFSPSPSLPARVIQIVKEKLWAGLDRRVMSRLSDRDLRDLGLNNYRNDAKAKDRLWHR